MYLMRSSSRDATPTGGALLLLAAAGIVWMGGGGGGVAAAGNLCTSDDTHVFHVRVNLFAGEFGYITFDECNDDANIAGGTPHPTLGLEIGQTYTFVQADKTNYFHPLGFAYQPDGGDGGHGMGGMNNNNNNNNNSNTDDTMNGGGAGSSTNATDDNMGGMDDNMGGMNTTDDNMGDVNATDDMPGMDDMNGMHHNNRVRRRRSVMMGTGAHGGMDVLQPDVSRGTSGCDLAATCPAPMYVATGLGGYLGMYSNDPTVAPVTANVTDFGLDRYMQPFYYPMREWLSYGNFSVTLRFDDGTYAKDLFYFCHIHKYMSGRIKLLRNGVPVSESDDPELGYEYDAPGTFDEGCGTYGLDAYQLPHRQCPDTYVCGLNESDTSTTNPSSGLQSYARCTNAMNCRMFAGMTTGVTAASPTALFIHQMIPHHQNAVNMAKSLLHSGALTCDDVMDDKDPGCNLEVLMMEIINSQNFQINQMRTVLQNEGYPTEDKCVVEITGSTIE